MFAWLRCGKSDESNSSASFLICGGPFGSIAGNVPILGFYRLLWIFCLAVLSKVHSFGASMSTIISGFTPKGVVPTVILVANLRLSRRSDLTPLSVGGPGTPFIKFAKVLRRFQISTSKTSSFPEFRSNQRLRSI
jgi:hypothetical protein